VAYTRHCPETTLLYRTVQEHWATFLTDLEVGGGELPAFVLDEFEAYLRCGILGPAAKDRAKVVPAPPEPGGPGGDPAGTNKAGEGEPRDIDITKMPRASHLPWALLLKRVFMTDALTCPKCTGRMTIVAAVTKPEAMRKILDHLGIASEAPRQTAARPPPQSELAGKSDFTEVDYSDPPSNEW
jgi:hypothetical protein